MMYFILGINTCLTGVCVFFLWRLYSAVDSVSYYNPVEEPVDPRNVYRDIRRREMMDLDEE